MLSVVIPTRNSKDLEDCLKSLKTQTYKNFEIIVVFDSKKDRCISLAKSYGARAVFDKNHSIGGAYHAGSGAAGGSIVVFIDDDCVAPKDWLEKIKNAFKGDIDILSGEDLLPENSTTFQAAAYQIDKARIIKKPLYGKSACKRFRAANIAYRKEVFYQENFNTRLKGLQEPEFHHRLYKKGFKMKFDPDVFVYHKRRNSLKEVFMQIYRNGRAKIELIKLHRDMISFIDVFPFLFILYSFSMVYASIVINTTILFLWIASMLLYFASKPLLIVAKTGDFRYYFHLFLIIFVREVAYAIGIISASPRLFRVQRHVF